MREVPGHRYIASSPPPVSLSDAAAFVLLGALELVAIVAAVRIWRQKGRSRLARLAWILLTLIPVIGLVLYAVLHDPPPPNGPTDRPPKRSWDI
jgi:formate-dependent nitrite reductase membrane component NrfD